MAFRSSVNQFFRTEASSGLVIVLACVSAMLVVNLGGAGWYSDLQHTQVVFEIGSFTVFSGSLVHLVNDGGMTIFFLVVGLELKREFVHGELRDWHFSKIPIAAAVGGMVVPALIYVSIADSSSLHGWAIPMATDTALALGVLSFFGSRISSSLRTFLLTLAVVDDIGAIAVISLFYSDGIDITALLLASLVVVLLLTIRWRGGWFPGPFILLGIGLWLCLYQSGIHPTVAGVIVGLLTPASAKTAPDEIDQAALNDLSSVDAAYETAVIARDSVSSVDWFERILHPWSSYLIVPIFAFLNSGIDLSKISFVDALTLSGGLAVFFGLVIGKLVGISLGSYLAIRFGRGILPESMRHSDLLVVGALGGIGFTVSLFITEAAFGASTVASDSARAAIMAASIFAAILASFILLFRHSGPRPASVSARE